jgi:hypothetical protein
MQHTTQAPTENAALEAWQAFLAKHQRLAGFLNIIGSVSGYFLNGHAIVALVRWLVTVAGRIAESALLLATLYVTLNNVAHTLLTWVVPAPGIELLNYLSVVAFSILPELIVGIAITTTYNHWKLFFRAPAWKNSAWVWGTLYLVPTSVFTVMTITTLASFVQIVAASGNPGQATGTALTVRFLAGWSYSLVEILFVTIGKKSYAERFDGLRLTIDSLHRESTTQRSTIAQLTEEVNGLRRESTTQQSTISQLTEEVNGLRQRSTQLQEQSLLDGATIDHLTAERSTLLQERDELQEALERLRKRNRSLRLADSHEVATVAEQATSAPDTGFIARDNGETIAVSNGTETVYATGSHRERIKAAMVYAYQHGQDIHYPTIAQTTGVAIGTVKKWGPQIKEEIVQQSTQSMATIAASSE